MDWGAEDAYEAATYDRRKALAEPKTYTIPGDEPPAEVQILGSLNKQWTLSRDGDYWVLEHCETGIIPAGPVPWEDLRYAYQGKMRDLTSTYKRAVAATWTPKDGPPPPRVGVMQLLDQDQWWVTRDKRALRLEEMEQTHVYNLVNFLRRHALRYKGAYEMMLLRASLSLQGEMALDAVDSEMAYLQAQDAVEWLMQMPLLQKLVQMLPPDVIDDEVMSIHVEGETLPRTHPNRPRVPLELES